MFKLFCVQVAFASLIARLVGRSIGAVPVPVARLRPCVYSLFARPDSNRSLLLACALRPRCTRTRPSITVLCSTVHVAGPSLFLISSVVLLFVCFRISCFYRRFFLALPFFFFLAESGTKPPV